MHFDSMVAKKMPEQFPVPVVWGGEGIHITTPQCVMNNLVCESVQPPNRLSRCGYCTLKKGETIFFAGIRLNFIPAFPTAAAGRP